VRQTTGEVGAEGHRDELAQRAEVLDPDPQPGSDAAARPVRADQVARPELRRAAGGLVAQLRGYALGVEPETGEPGAEPDPATHREQVLDTASSVG